MASWKDDLNDAPTELAPRLVRPTGESLTFSLSVLAGPEQGQQFTVAPGPSRVLAGTSPACGICLSDRQVSRRHAAFEIAGARLRVTDLGSRNGTYAQNLLVLDAYLAGGELVRLGETVLRADTLGAAEPEDLSRAARFGKLVGTSVEMRRLYPLCERLAASVVPVILEGETGTGKEVLAEALHEASPRAAGPFVVFDCTAVPPTLVESALFGHERGAFTGATETRRGVFEEAHGGTLLLDEIGDLELSLQAKLLRAIQRSEVQRVGSNRWIRVDVRILAATRRDLDREIQAGRFRDDLYYRLAVARIELPPLRRRKGDATILAHHFWRQLAGRALPFPPGFAERLEDYDWPGNIRELHNAVARRVALGDSAPIETARGPTSSSSGTLPAVPQPSRLAALEGSGAAPIPAAIPDDFIEEVLSADLPLPRARERVIDHFERRYVQRVLAHHGGNVRNAAAASGIARRYFQILRARLGS